MIAPMIEPIHPALGGGSAALPWNKSCASQPPTKEPTMPRTMVGIQPMESLPGMRNRAITPTIAPKMIQVMIAVRSMFRCPSFPCAFPPACLSQSLCQPAGRRERRSACLAHGLLERVHGQRRGAGRIVASRRAIRRDRTSLEIDERAVERAATLGERDAEARGEDVVAVVGPLQRNGGAEPRESSGVGLDLGHRNDDPHRRWGADDRQP